MEALSRVLAIALTPIRGNVISPDITTTPLFEAMDKQPVENVLETYKANLLIHRFATRTK